MKRVLVKSLFDCFDFVVDYKGNDTFAIISIQDSRPGGFGFEFVKTPYCRDVLTLQFDDAEIATDGITLFSPEQARQIISFIQTNQKRVDLLIIHCYAGQSRSLGVGAFAVKMLGADNKRYFEVGVPNRLVYDTLLKVYEEQN